MKFPKYKDKRDRKTVPMQRKVMYGAKGPPFYSPHDIRKGLDMLVQLLRAIFVVKGVTEPEFWARFTEYKRGVEGLIAHKDIEGARSNLHKALRKRNTISMMQFHRALAVLGYIPKNISITVEDMETHQDETFDLNDLLKKVAETEGDRVHVKVTPREGYDGSNSGVEGGGTQ